MRPLMRGFATWSAILLAACLCGQPLSAQMKLLWDIGTADDDTAEFALAPDGYRDYDKDGFYIVGRSAPAQDWPYTHPGPADNWAGAKAHTFTILFALREPLDAESRLIVDLVDTHGIRPPTFRIEVNDRSYTRKVPKGASDATITGDPSVGREHRFSVDIPSGVLEAGLNEIRISNVELSWVLYDWVGFEVGGEAELAEPRGVVVKSVRLDPWLTREDGELSQLLELTVASAGDGDTVTVDADGIATTRTIVESGINTIRLRLPPVEGAKERQIRLKAGGEILATRHIVQKPARERMPVDYVDPMLGTSSSRWMLYPGPSMPFGMVKLSPDNQEKQWKAGYEYYIDNIAGFSHLHSWTMGGLLTMPTTGELKTRPGPVNAPDDGYRSRFSHEQEQASAGYYAVTLDDYDIRAELTATTRAGFQRYTFPKAEKARILFDLQFPTEYGFSVLDAHITKVSNREIEGYARQRSTGWNEYTVHFVARFSKPFNSMGVWAEDRITWDVDEGSGNGDVGAWVSYATGENEVVQVQTGISLVSIEQARLNLDREMSPFGWDFDAARAHARDVWSDLLGKIEVSGGTQADKIKFYTGLYRSYCSRTILSDVNGKYVDMYEHVQQLDDPASPVYGCDAFWNTFWNLNQLWTLVTPDIASKWVRSLLEIYDVGGWLPKGPTGIEYSSIMVASHEIALIAAAYQKGIRDFDVEKAYEAIKHIQTTPGQPHEGGGHVGNRQLDSYMRLGYVPVEKGPLSNTLEYAYDDWCVAQMAKALGKQEDYEYFSRRAKNYLYVFDQSVGFVRQKHENGEWVEDFNEFSHHGFVEGNSWQYTWFVPHDVHGLIDLMGCRAYFTRRLDEGFEKAKPRFVSGHVQHGNQPNMQAAYLFNYSGAPWLTQKWARQIMEHYYGTGPADGYPGDEDQGQMGAWYAMSAMGLFEMDGGAACEPIYEIGSPVFDRVVIHLAPEYYEGGTFTIVAENNSPENMYVQSASLDGKPLNRPWFRHAELVDGGKLRLRMGPEPNRGWGSALAAAPRF